MRFAVKSNIQPLVPLRETRQVFVPLYLFVKQTLSLNILHCANIVRVPFVKQSLSLNILHYANIVCVHFVKLSLSLNIWCCANIVHCMCTFYEAIAVVKHIVLLNILGSDPAV